MEMPGKGGGSGRWDAAMCGGVCRGLYAVEATV
jgi:hypothetical protein